jgi:hypothetical protein
MFNRKIVSVKSDWVGNMNISIPYSTKLASLIKFIVLTPINKMGLQSTSIVI